VKRNLAGMTVHQTACSNFEGWGTADFMCSIERHLIVKNIWQNTPAKILQQLQFFGNSEKRIIILPFHSSWIKTSVPQGI